MPSRLYRRAAGKMWILVGLQIALGHGATGLRFDAKRIS
jgi:hypothetical protein